jgi:hypothetical protein
MKPHGKPGKKKDSEKKPARCPCFRFYYVGVCAGHNFPYTPTPGEKKQYCMTADFHLCLIYEQHLAGRERERK